MSDAAKKNEKGDEQIETLTRLKSATANWSESAVALDTSIPA